MAVGFAGCGPASADPLLREFAICAGRFSALVEHQWLLDGPASDASVGTRDSLLALVEAVQEPGMGARVMGWRIEAKVAQKALLARAHFARDSAAEMRAAELLLSCAGLVGQSWPGTIRAPGGSSMTSSLLTDTDEETKSNEEG